MKKAILFLFVITFFFGLAHFASATESLCCNKKAIEGAVKSLNVHIQCKNYPGSYGDRSRGSVQCASSHAGCISLYYDYQCYYVADNSSVQVNAGMCDGTLTASISGKTFVNDTGSLAETYGYLSIGGAGTIKGMGFCANNLGEGGVPTPGICDPWINYFSSASDYEPPSMECAPPMYSCYPTTSSISGSGSVRVGGYFSASLTGLFYLNAFDLYYYANYGQATIDQYLKVDSATYSCSPVDYNEFVTDAFGYPVARSRSRRSNVATKNLRLYKR